MKYGGHTHVGKVRDKNQDSYYINYSKKLPAFAVADGMGGYTGGEIASEIVIEVIKNNLDIYFNKILNEKLLIEKFIKKTLELSNEEIYKVACENEKYKGMGTTITMGCILNDKLFIGHIVDSRAYMIRDNNMKKITEDHSLVAELVKNGSITEDEAINHPQKNVITRALGTNLEVNIDIFQQDLKNNDIILICTDGLTNMVREKEILEEVNRAEDMQELCDNLINQANKNGGHDNSTVVAIKVDKK